jgi:hypothetical protein
MIERYSLHAAVEQNWLVENDYETYYFSGRGHYVPNVEIHNEEELSASYAAPYVDLDEVKWIPSEASSPYCSSAEIRWRQVLAGYRSQKNYFATAYNINIAIYDYFKGGQIFLVGEGNVLIKNALPIKQQDNEATGLCVVNGRPYLTSGVYIKDNYHPFVLIARPWSNISSAEFAQVYRMINCAY